MRNHGKTYKVDWRTYVRRYPSFTQGVKDKRVKRWREFPNSVDQRAYENGRVFGVVAPDITSKMVLDAAAHRGSKGNIDAVERAIKRLKKAIL